MSLQITTFLWVSLYIYDDVIVITSLCFVISLFFSVSSSLCFSLSTSRISISDIPISRIPILDKETSLCLNLCIPLLESLSVLSERTNLSTSRGDNDNFRFMLGVLVWLERSDNYYDKGANGGISVWSKNLRDSVVTEGV